MTYSLREINREDIKTINSWRNDIELIALLGNNFHYIGEETDYRWFENYMATRSTNVRLAILSDASPTLIGIVQLTGIHHINRSAEYSIMIGEKSYWSKGAGYFATQAILLHGFRNLNLHRIHLTVLEDNERAIKMYEKSGFRREGVLRDSIFKEGHYKNTIIMSILNTELKTN